MQSLQAVKQGIYVKNINTCTHVTHKLYMNNFAAAAVIVDSATMA